ncbi:glucose-1-phosphatase [Serratia entomophila]|uniref:glucose-1-phosphatase n=1 Tax=Serratia entomophila TaxID=42906 RepID=UPI002178E309|nr:glucose-1-phosphatase [Serratia entomophila]CAI1142329.1 Phosphatase yihX [Serratia entomophila]CAI1153862.1 Phosphatase yihX [Serratia entomophila]CAI1984906.1 Phosphatase yihX [Serratia entomophila]CAI1994708.1 Phosphatase yihX [Serratia entomophila]CAI1997227.1 Phosphatase yihX [Serratia entomophila]
MLYIFDLGNVIVDIDFKRVLGVWSNLSGTPLAVLSDRFAMGEVFQQHERGQISDEDFAGKLCEEMGIALSFEQFATGWQAVFVALRPEVIDIMQRLRNEGHRVVVLSNTNRLHCNYWPQHYPEVATAADHLYLSQDLGMRKPDANIYLHVLNAENAAAEDAVFFDDVPANVAAAQALGIKAVLVSDRDVVPAYFAQ